MLLGGFALPLEAALLDAIDRVGERSPFRHMLTPGGRRMSVAMTNCGALGWVSDRSGYRYAALDPADASVRGRRCRRCFSSSPRDAAERAGFPGFVPDACLVNRYEPGARLTLHQDRDERDFSAPIVSVSLGLPAVFLFGGEQRADRPQRVALDARRRRGLGRPGAAALSRRAAARGRPSPR